MDLRGKPLIKGVVLPLIHSLTDEAMESLSSKQLEAKTKEADKASSILIDAKVYVALAKRFTARQNWQGFASAFAAGRLKTSDRGRRILQFLVEMGAP